MAKVERMYQDEPQHFRKQSFKLKSWTETVVGYMNEADKLSRCILRNRQAMKRDYTWAVSINVEVELPAKAVKDIWTKVVRKLNARGVEALWVREPSKSNHVNYHLLVKNEMTKEELERLIEESMPDRVDVPYHKQVKPIDSQFHYARYITKAKTRGIVNGKEVADKYRDKRLLFQPKLALRKYGTIGTFWERSKATLWAEIRAVEKQIGEGLEKPNVRRLARHVYEMLGEAVPIERIERSFGYYSDTPGVQDWIDKLFGQDAGE